MLKIKTKFRCIIALHMCIPIAVIIGYAQGTPLFYNTDFQGALGVSVGVCILLAFCSPMLPGLKWILFSQLNLVSRICSHIKTGKYTYFSLPNEPTDDSEENEMVALMRDMNWMIRQIESREAELENRVVRRTRALKKSNTALVAARDEARASARAKSEFLTTMSHEIRTPMNAVIGMSNLALKANQDPDMKEYLSIIHSSSVSLLRIINDILDFSKMDAGKLVLETIPVRIRDLLEEISDMFRGPLSGGSVELILDISPTVPGTVPGDPLRLRQVLTNLISNAIKFTREGEVIVRVTFEAKDNGWADLRFSVEDSGIGMDDAAVKSLFTPFTQADGSITREFGGTGLGLAISQKLVSLMGGQINVHSETDKGSCFSFTLAVERALTEENQAPELPDHFRGKSVMLAVANPANRKVLTGFLTDFGLNVLPPEETARVEAPALAIVDTALAEGDLEAARELAGSACPEVPLIALGMSGDRIKETQSAWADRFVPKPVKQSMLFDTLMEIFHPQEPEQAQEKPRPAKVPEHHLKLLVVEDNRINRKVADEILRSVGIIPRMADSGKAALEMIKTTCFDAVLMDIQMPEMDGYTTTARIRETHPHLPVIAMTANALAEDRKRGISAGMTAYVTKPVDPEKLFSTLERILDTRIVDPETDSSGVTRYSEQAPWILPGIDTETALKRLRGNRDALTELVREFGHAHRDVLSLPGRAEPGE